LLGVIERVTETVTDEEEEEVEVSTLPIKHSIAKRRERMVPIAGLCMRGVVAPWILTPQKPQRGPLRGEKLARIKTYLGMERKIHLAEARQGLRKEA
jgi:hypothetical protein